MSRSRLLVALTLVAATAVLTGCSLVGDPDADSTGTDGSVPLTATDTDRTSVDDLRSGGTLRIATPRLPRSLNPADPRSAGPDLDRLLGPTTGSAVRLDDQGGWQVDRDYARSVRLVDRSPLTAEVRLAPRARWQGGEPITSADAVAYWRVARDPERSGVAAPPGWSDVTSVEARGDLTYRVRFGETRADWPLFVYPRLPRSTTRDVGSPSRPIQRPTVPANGPFVVDSVDRASGSVTLRRNPLWWGARPRLERIVWRIADGDLVRRAFDAGDLDAYLPSPTGRLVTPDDAVVRRAASPTITRLTLNAGSEPLSDDRVRRAIALAVDRRALAEHQGRDLGIEPTPLAGLLTPPGQRDVAPAARAGAPDLDAARGLLRRAGFSTDTSGAGRDGRRARLRLVVPAGDTAIRDRADRIATDLRAVGVRVEVRRVDPDSFTQDVLVPLDFELVLQSSALPALAVGSLVGQFTPRDSADNVTGAATTDPADWSAASSLDAGERRAAVARLEAALSQAAVAVPLLDEPHLLVARPEVANLGVHTWAAVDWRRVGLRR